MAFVSAIEMQKKELANILPFWPMLGQNYNTYTFAYYDRAWKKLEFKLVLWATHIFPPVAASCRLRPKLSNFNSAQNVNWLHV